MITCTHNDQKLTLPPPNPQTVAALAKTPILATINHLQTIEAALTTTPVMVPTLAKYVTAPSTSTPIYVPTQTPSTFVPLPTTILPVPPPQMNAAEFIDLICRSISENVTGIPNAD